MHTRSPPRASPITHFSRRSDPLVQELARPRVFKSNLQCLATMSAGYCPSGLTQRRQGPRIKPF